ncbi:MAG: hypothetical protein IPK31_04635 [Chitinophagaceae bacterium]|nr:hypothetical protein [Chitinophagaceae bacterium]
MATTDESTSENEYIIIDTADLRNKRLTADSVVQVNDSVYHFFDCPNYTFLTTYSTDEYSVAKVLSSVQLYHLIIKNYQRPDVAKVKEELNQLIKKYKYIGNKRDYYYSDMVVAHGKTSYYNLIEGRYILPEVNASISNITQKKYRWQDNNDSRFRVWLYLTLVFTLLIFIFRHSTVKTFFLSILTGIILLVLSALIMAFFRFNEKGMYIMMLLYYICFFAVATLGFNSKKRMAVTGIAINIITIFTSFLPLICVSFYYELLKDKYRLTPYPADYSTKKDFHLLIAEIAGIVVLIILIEPLFKRLYRNWFSKPEQ